MNHFLVKEKKDLIGIRFAELKSNFFFEKKYAKKATTNQNSNNVLPLRPLLLEADIIGVLRVRGLHPHIRLRLKFYCQLQ